LPVSSSSPSIEPTGPDGGEADPPFPLLRRAGDTADAENAQQEPGDDDENSRRLEVGTIEVLVRLTDGDVVLAGRFADVEEAKECAEGLVESLGDSERRWPFVSGRFLRPGAIVSIDINENGPKWTGSAGRAASWSTAQQRAASS
jgi:hypothetical protein